MTELVSGAGATVAREIERERARSFKDLPAKRDAPIWVRTAKREDPDKLWRLLREELPRALANHSLLPAEREARFPQNDSVLARAESVLSGSIDVQTVSGADDLERLQLLVVLLDGLGRGDYPPEDESLRDLWWWAWEESARFASPESRFDDSLSRMLHAETLMASGLLFAGFAGMRSRSKAGRKRLWNELALQTDTDGMPHASLLNIMPAWIAALIRCGAWARAGGLKWGKPDELEFCDGLLTSLAAMLRPDGTCALSTGDDVAAWLLSGGRLLGRKNSHPLSRFLAGLRTDAKPVLEKSSRRAGGTTSQSEWAKLTAVRSGWRPEADLLTLRHDGHYPALEWRIAGEAVLAGDWELEIRVDGTPVVLTPDWEAVSWFQDREAAYLELQWSESRDLVVCRQILFTRNDQQLWLAEAVSTPARPDSEIEVTSRLPVTADWGIEQCRPTRELRWRDRGGRSIRCVPLSFPMEGTQAGPGVIRAGAGEFQIQQSGRGGVYCPLLFDWHAPRRKASLDWRTLTVSEDGRRLTGAEAAAARVRIGPQQWVISRNMNGSRAMRAVIGYHHNQESVIGHFTRDGEVDPLVLVEAAD